MRGLRGILLLGWRDIFYTSPLCFATQNIGERPKKQLFLRRGVERSLFILLSSEKNEPRSAAAVIGLLACRYGRRRGLRNSLRSNSPRPFPSVFLASSPPDKGGIGDCCFCLYSNPLALWALPLYSLTETQGERLRFDFVAIAVFQPPLFY